MNTRIYPAVTNYGSPKIHEQGKPSASEEKDEKSGKGK